MVPHSNFTDLLGYWGESFYEPEGKKLLFFTMVSARPGTPEIVKIAIAEDKIKTMTDLCMFIIESEQYERGVGLLNADEGEKLTIEVIQTLQEERVPEQLIFP